MVGLFDYFEETEAWQKAYLRPEVISGEWELMSDEPIPDLFVFPFLTETGCNAIIEAAEKANAWTTDRHYYYPTHDMELEQFDFQRIYESLIDRFAVQAAADLFQESSIKDIVSENFIIKYTPDVQGHLGLHHDQSLFTLNVLLNDDFEGGGTYFSKQKLLLKPPVGSAILHPGFTHRHGSRPVISGTRYVLISFCRSG